jgi:hypothetical protein
MNKGRKEPEIAGALRHKVLVLVRDDGKVVRADCVMYDLGGEGYSRGCMRVVSIVMHRHMKILRRGIGRILWRLNTQVDVPFVTMRRVKRHHFVISNVFVFGVNSVAGWLLHYGRKNAGIL